jgi:hypothetical protein
VVLEALQVPVILTVVVLLVPHPNDPMICIQLVNLLGIAMGE